MRGVAIVEEAQGSDGPTVGRGNRHNDANTFVMDGFHSSSESFGGGT